MMPFIAPSSFQVPLKRLEFAECVDSQMDSILNFVTELTPDGFYSLKVWALNKCKDKLTTDDRRNI